MKLSENCLNVLKNFSSINPSILVKSGNTIKTISPQRTIFAKAELDEVFPSDFAIYELSKFLGALTLFDDAEVEFFDEHLKISHNKNSIRYTYADPSMIITPPDKDITLPSVDISFELTSEDLARLQKALSILRVPEMSITGEDGTIYVKAVNNKNPSSDSFSIAVGVSDKAFNMIFKAENLKIMNRNYTVNISSKGISEFKSDNLTYWIVTESQSKFED